MQNSLRCFDCQVTFHISVSRANCTEIFQNIPNIGESTKPNTLFFHFGLAGAQATERWSQNTTPTGAQVAAKWPELCLI